MNTKITGYWGHEPITRPLTQEERVVSELRLHDKEGKLTGKTDKEVLAIVNLGKGLLSDKDQAKLLNHVI